jgi:hypothetical protein
MLRDPTVRIVWFIHRAKTRGASSSRWTRTWGCWRIQIQIATTKASTALIHWSAAVMLQMICTAQTN